MDCNPAGATFWGTAPRTVTSIVPRQKNAVKPAVQDFTAFRVAKSPLKPCGWLFHIEELDLEDEGGVRRNVLARATASVGQFRRADKFRLAADLHLLDTFGPAGDYARKREFDGLFPFVGAVELWAVS